MKNRQENQLFLGVDGGGTRCRVRISDAVGAILGEAVRGGANTRLGLDPVFHEIIDATREALSKAGLPAETIAQLHAGLGLAGLPLQRERDLARTYPHPFASATFETDAYTACLGAHAGKDGAILILGTGTCGQAILGDRQLSLGGWGFEISDIGSGARIGKRAIEQALLAHEGLSPSSDLTATLMTQFDNNPENIVIFAEKARPSDYGAFCPMVFDAADAGDPVATAIINRAATANDTILRRLNAFGAQRLTLMGGLADRMAPLMSANMRDLLVSATGDALDGAILMAKRHRGNGS
ncbi:MAG: BadF/BadG/BcrA/BcrD ATPase family protein [Pseudomonadota bacterium]